MSGILAVRPDSLGDVVLMGPAVRALATAGPVTMLVSPRGEAAARRLPGVTDVLVHELPWIAADPPPVRALDLDVLLGEVRATGVREAVVFTSFHQSALPTALALRLAGVARIGAYSDDYPGSLLDVRLPSPRDVHEVERALALVTAMGHELPSDDDGALALRGDHTALARDDTVVVHPGAAMPARAWEPARLAALVDALVARGRDVVVTGGPDEVALGAAIARAPRAHVTDLTGRTGLDGLLRVLARASVVVTGNTGPAHLAAAVGTPVVSLFAPTVPAARWRPWRVPHILLGHQDVPCAGCRARVCPVEGHPCLDVPVGDVVDAVEVLGHAHTFPPGSPPTPHEEQQWNTSHISVT